MKIPQNLKNKKQDISNNIALIIGLPKGDKKLNPISFIIKHCLEAYFYPNNIILDKDNLNLYDEKDKYGRRKLFTDLDIVKKFPYFWDNVGSDKEVLLYIEFNEKLLSQIFKECSYPTLLRIPSSKSKIKSMKNRCNKTLNLLGIYLDIEQNKFYILGETTILKKTFDLVLDNCDWSLSPM